jgi:molybdopterin synthase catalytic subunit
VAIELLRIGPEPLLLDGLIAAVSAETDPGRNGAIAIFLGLVRNHHQGRRVLYLEYEAYEPLARRALDRIAAEAAERWPAAAMAVHHRVGRLAVGEASVAVAAASAHRADAFTVCRYAIERVKQIVPVWKHEFFEDGDAWVEGATADPDDRAALEAAERVACT